MEQRQKLQANKSSPRRPHFGPTLNAVGPKICARQRAAESDDDGAPGSGGNRLRSEWGSSTTRKKCQASRRIEKSARDPPAGRGRGRKCGGLCSTKPTPSTHWRSAEAPGTRRRVAEIKPRWLPMGHLSSPVAAQRRNEPLERV